MTRGKPKTGKTLSPAELSQLKDEQREVNETLRTLDGQGTEQYGQGTKAAAADRAALQRQERKLQDAIDAGSPKRFSTGYQKDKAWKEAQQLQERMSEHMPTKAEMENLRKHPGADRKELNWQRNNAQNVARWKELQRQLNPGDPTASSIENFRR